MGYADLECLVGVPDKRTALESGAFEYYNHLPKGVMFILVSTVSELAKIPFKEYHGRDCTECLLQELSRL